MAVSQKIIGANAQPNGGVGLVGNAGARGLDSASKIDANHTLDPYPIGAAFLDMSIADIDAALDTRFDDPRYYSGDAPT